MQPVSFPRKGHITQIYLTKPRISQPPAPQFGEIFMKRDDLNAHFSTLIHNFIMETEKLMQHKTKDGRADCGPFTLSQETLKADFCHLTDQNLRERIIVCLAENIKIYLLKEDPAGLTVTDVIQELHERADEKFPNIGLFDVLIHPKKSWRKISDYTGSTMRFTSLEFTARFLEELQEADCVLNYQSPQTSFQNNN